MLLEPLLYVLTESLQLIQSLLLQMLRRPQLALCLELCVLHGLCALLLPLLEVLQLLVPPVEELGEAFRGHLELYLFVVF